MAEDVAALSPGAQAAVDTVVETLRGVKNHAPQFAEQIRAACGIFVTADAAVYAALCAHPRVRVIGTQLSYVPVISGVTSSKELLAKLREFPRGVPRGGV